MRTLWIKLAVTILFTVCIAVIDNLTGYPYDKISNVQGFLHNDMLLLTAIVVWNVGKIDKGGKE